MSKQSNYDSDSMHKSSPLNLLHKKKWNVLRTGVLWAQRFKSVKNTKSSEMTYTPLNNKNYDYIDKLQKRNTVIKHYSSAKRLAKTFSSSINVNTVTSKSSDFESSNDLSKSPLLFSSRFQSSMYESNKDFKEVRFICEDSSRRNSVITNEIINNTDTTNNKQVVNTITHKTNYNENNSTINRKESVHNDSSENNMKTLIINGFWPGNPYSPLPSPDISILDSDLNESM
ncbi:hypothetical protein Smp_166770 [Schistosoma mansoni]|uniref:hypothetical protein n=1 Tax=Schistosoma mansoni TaxID=6183 RepID=UPI00019B379B|nr:hypothetical protein Smp_166770 [Schistosoma mansoni]|eukprot:XP_018650714.1 hypothetical protein Smp_166770 [Schistosoma mansoni]